MTPEPLCGGKLTSPEGCTVPSGLAPAVASWRSSSMVMDLTTVGVLPAPGRSSLGRAHGCIPRLPHLAGCIRPQPGPSPPQ